MTRAASLRYFCAHFQLRDYLTQVERVAAGVNTHVVSAQTGYGLQRLNAICSREKRWCFRALPVWVSREQSRLFQSVN